MKTRQGVVVTLFLLMGPTIAVSSRIADLSSRTVVTQSAPTFAEHVAPVLFKNCVGCHRPGQSAPFSLLTYQDAREHGAEMSDAVRTHFMPPWKPAVTDFPFQGERHLAEGDIDTIVRWVKAGMPQGDPKRTPSPPALANQDWPLGRPDLILTMPESFTVPANGRDTYRNFVLPLPFNVSRWVKAVDIRPQARPVVHHVTFFVDTSGGARALDAADPGPGFAGVMGGTGVGGERPRDMIANVLNGQPAVKPGARPSFPVGGQTPGAAAHKLPDDLAFFVPAKSDLVISFHFHSNGQEMQERSSIGIYFAPQPPKRPFSAIQLPVYVSAFKGINIPPGEKNYVITDSFIVPMDLKAFAVGAHAHYLGKDVKLTATFPDGRKKTLFWIPDWDLNFQGQYYFNDYVALPAGTRLDAAIRYDNSADNPHNPSSPPQRVTFGEQSTNEMGAITLFVVGDKSPVLTPLQEATQKHVRESILASPMMRGRRGR